MKATNNKKNRQKQTSCELCHNINVPLYMQSCPCGSEWAVCENCFYKVFKQHIQSCKIGGIEETKFIDIKISKPRNGLCGLSNLGNTCFMNTSLQCLSNCWELTNYFLQEKYRKDINLKNPIGFQGKICRIYANVLQNLWLGSKNEYAPRNFKQIIDTLNDNFAGHYQQDAEEFLTFLIDALHEDLNRVINKQYNPSTIKTADDEIQEHIAWYNFKSRNQSVLIDLFYGQFKSLLFCPNNQCQYISTSFEPFCCLPLPIESKHIECEVICFFIFYDISIKPIRLELMFDNDYNLMVLRNKIGLMLNIHPFSFVIEKMDSSGNLASLAIYNQLFSSSSKIPNDNNAKPYFLLQIDPNIFYKEINNIYIKDNEVRKYRISNYEETLNDLNNNHEIKKLFYGGYRENSEGAPKSNNECYYKTKDNCVDFGDFYSENNYGLNKDFLMVLVHISCYKTNKINHTFDVIFPRILFINKNSTGKDIHHQVFDFFKPVFYPNSKITFNDAFPNLNTNLNTDSVDYQKKNNLPYRLRIRNINQKLNKPCLICKKNNCFNCLFPYSSEITLRDIINKYPLNSEGKTIDNTYYYLSTRQREKIDNKDLSFEITITFEKKQEIFMLLNDYEKKHFNMLNEVKNGIAQIDECFSNFSGLEELDKTNEFYCEKCKTIQKAKKQMMICRAPHFLILQLKRFVSNTKGVAQKSKILVNFPITGLDMKKYINYNYEQFPMIYDLIAVAYQIGEADYGHYYAAVKNPMSDRWYKCDDHIIKEISVRDIVTNDAYILFYRRRGLENILDLENLYQSGFINHQQMLNDYEMNFKLIEEILNEK